MKPLHRLLAITLLALLGLPFATPLLAAATGGGANLPACCRRDGKHRCMATMAETDTGARSARAPHERCPYCPAQTVAPHLPHFGPVTSQAIFAAIASHPAVHAQTESQRRISQDRARQKRGPPSSLQA